MRNHGFAEGFMDGFAAIGGFFRPHEMVEDNSVELAWREVGDLMHEAMGQVRQEEAMSGNPKAAITMTRTRIKSLKKQAAELEAAASAEEQILEMLEYADKPGYSLRLKKARNGESILVLKRVSEAENGTPGKIPD